MYVKTLFFLKMVLKKRLIDLELATEFKLKLGFKPIAKC